MDLKNLDQKVKSDITIQKVLGLTNNLELKTPSFEKGFDAYVFITWTVYAGRLNKEKAFIWIDLLEKAKANDVKVKYYLLNFDFQESWNMTDEQIEKLGLKE